MSDNALTLPRAGDEDKLRAMLMKLFERGWTETRQETQRQCKCNGDTFGYWPGNEYCQCVMCGRVMNVQ